MDDVGSELRQAREQCGLSLRQLADLTKIRPSVLRAIERNDTTGLPGGIYTRNFVKAYAREVGLDPTATARQFAEQFTPPIAPVGRRDQPLAAVDAPRSRSTTEFARAAGPIAAAALVVIACLTLFNEWNKSRALRHVENARASELVSALPPSSSQDTTGVSVQTAVASSPDTTGAPAKEHDTALRVDLLSRGLCWISATADGERVAYRLMDAGERQTIEAQRELVLRIGEPANLDVSINGSSGRPLGRAGEPTTIRVTPQNYRDFLNP